MSKTLKNALLVFAGGWCYGFITPLVKIGHSLGFGSTELMAIQYLIGILVLGIAFLVIGRPKISLRQMIEFPRQKDVAFVTFDLLSRGYT